MRTIRVDNITAISPANNAWLTTGTANLIRSASPYASGYLYQVSSDSGFTNIVISGNKTTTGVSLIGFLEKPYYRRVAAYDSGGTPAIRTNPFMFTIDLTSTLNFTGSSPADNARIISNSFTTQLDISEYNLSTFKRARNGSNYYSIYDSGLMLMLNFDKVAALGETDGFINDASQYGVYGSGYNGVTRTGNGKYG